MRDLRVLCLTLLLGACVPGEEPPGGDGGSVGELCGGFAGVACEDASQYCKFEPATKCGSGDQGGTCTDKPQACYDIYKPVCGCDDKTYGNDCEAASAGVSVQHDGACSSGDPGGAKSCGGLLGVQCAADQFCNYPVGARCGAADQTGSCTSKPQVCSLIYAPVCGCDGKTYASSCSAESAGVSVLHDGPC